MNNKKRPALTYHDFVKRVISISECEKLGTDRIQTIYSQLQHGNFHESWRRNIQTNLQNLETAFDRLQRRKQSSSPEEEIRNLEKKISAEMDQLLLLEKKSKKIELLKRDLQLKIERQRLRLEVLRSLEN